ncbi:hypothetical protein [Rhodococcus sp. BS-15]|uniref:hypothetical protein n=1 Tax=Rhodococcus sp. BS-15 TaxID=1304954 RepID=UPI000AB5D19E|nr:hypothetical protein [Rhodococcus sp. BS-15]
MSARSDAARSIGDKLDTIVELLGSIDGPDKTEAGQTIRISTEIGVVEIWESANDPGWKWSWNH